MDQKQNAFLGALTRFILEVKAMKQFKGKSQAIRSLERISKLSVFQ